APALAGGHVTTWARRLPASAGPRVDLRQPWRAVTSRPGRGGSRQAPARAPTPAQPRRTVTP
ncbi:hypothetical protein, partial [Streptomyces solaniscabiei]|uniref:hypothetical protein n=1 Tax=Streptomyces solaniscabiei TaxID=2683255 RepID=UPI001CE32296